MSIAGKQALAIGLRQVRRDVDDSLRIVTQRAREIILSAVDGEGKVDETREAFVLSQVGETVSRWFVGPDRRSAFGNDGVTALASFPRILNIWYAFVVSENVRSHQRWMQRHLPEDVFNWLARTPLRSFLSEQENPFLRQSGESVEAYRQRLDDLRIFRPNPLAELDPNRRWVPMHRWTDANGYRLSDRIWQASERTRVKVDALLAEGIREGTSALELSRKLERFLLPSRANLRTKKPYGVNASYDAMRIARSEIARAANQASFIASYLNPYVDSIEVARSATGDPLCTICPQHATLGIGGERLRPPYSIHAAHLPIYHPHCKCLSRPVVTDSPEVVSERLRAVMQDARQDLLMPVMTPAQADNFILDLLGHHLATLIRQAA